MGERLGLVDRGAHVPVHGECHAEVTLRRARLAEQVGDAGQEAVGAAEGGDQRPAHDVHALVLRQHRLKGLRRRLVAEREGGLHHEHELHRPRRLDSPGVEVP
ncbi:MAG TPA: hypothetical protein VFN60_06735, partial [Acidimicrobiales bacterium]|nr:hypothetical protein [Acidimicrobiales bacterium]